MRILNGLTEKNILKLRVNQLSPKLTKHQKTVLKKLNAQLKKQGLNWSPFSWFSSEWFSPDGVAGFAIPFMLSDPKLTRLEHKYLGLCEGANINEFYKLTAHETGHAIDNAYKLRLSKSRQALFGLTSTPYPQSYIPCPESNEYISFLGDFYSQAHPDEDWAETFAYVLTKKSLEEKYKNTLVEAKYNFVKQTLQNLPNGPKKWPKQELIGACKSHVHDNRTIEQYLVEKKESLNLHKKTFFHYKLKKCFTSKVKDGKYISPIMLQNKKLILSSLEKGSKHNSWVINKCFEELNKEYRIYNYQSNDTEDKKITIIHNILNSSLDGYVKRGHTRVFM